MLLRLIDIFVLIIIVTKALLHEYNLLKITMRYNLLNVEALKELPEVIMNLRSIVDNYEYFNNKSVDIIVSMAIAILNISGDILIDEKLIGIGDYAYKKTIKYDVTRNTLYDFVLLIERIRKTIYAENIDRM